VTSLSDCHFTRFVRRLLAQNCACTGAIFRKSVPSALSGEKYRLHQITASEKIQSSEGDNSFQNENFEVLAAVLFGIRFL